MLIDEQDAFGHMMMDFYIGNLITTPVILMTSKPELEQITEDTAWTIDEHLDDTRYPAVYIAVMKKGVQQGVSR